MTSDEARESVRTALLRIVPDADLDEMTDDEDMRDALELDSLDFLAFVETLSERAGVRIDEDDYPQLRTLRSTLEFLGARGKPV